MNIYISVFEVVVCYLTFYLSVYVLDYANLNNSMVIDYTISFLKFLYQNNNFFNRL